MDRTKIAKSLNSQPAIDDVARLSRRDMLAGIGLVSVCAVAMLTLLVSSPAEASMSAPTMAPEAAPVDPAKSEADHDTAVEGSEPLELSARRRYWRYGYRRRYWRYRYWRRRRYWRYRYWRPRYYRRRRYWRYRY